MTAGPIQAETPQAPDRIVLEDFSHYPDGWKAARGRMKANEIYQLANDDEGDYLRALERSEPVRIFKKISWDSKTFPTVEWKWRIKKWPQSEDAQFALYVSLDKDIFGIPTIIKYVWSRDVEEGTVKDGGFFRPMEVVIHSGPADSDGWIIERVNVRADFQQLIGREPRGEAYGIGLLADPGMIVEIGEIVALRE